MFFRECFHLQPEQILIPAGSEKFRGIVRTHFSQAVGAVLVFDITDKKSFQDCQYWVDELRHNCQGEPKVLLIGNKLDLVTESNASRAVSYEEARLFAAKHNFLYFESSALIHKNVKEAFETLVLRPLSRIAERFRVDQEPE